MTLNAATRAALRKRKLAQMPTVGPASDMQLREARDATVSKLAELLKGATGATKIAKDIEEQLFQDNKGLTTEYRAAFRRIYTALKAPSSGFVEELSSGDLDGKEFAKMSPEELKSATLKKKEEEMKEEAIRQSVSKEMLPENIQQVMDGRDREKWGVSRSAAAIDD